MWQECMFGLGDVCIVWCGDNMKMFGDKGCINYSQFFNWTLVGHQIFTGES